MWLVILLDYFPYKLEYRSILTHWLAMHVTDSELLDIAASQENDPV